MLNLLTSVNKKRSNPKVDGSYNRKFMMALLNLEVLTQEDKFIATRGLVERNLN